MKVALLGTGLMGFPMVQTLLREGHEVTAYNRTRDKAAPLKLALNQLIASLTAAFGLSLELVRKNGVDLEIFMDILRDSALYSPQFNKKLPRILQQDYDDPNFPTKHLLKDVDLIVQAADSAGLENAGINGVRKIIKNAIEKGYGETDYSSLVEGLSE
ncbi:MAG: 2-hydroxy-3-oxopropionate reductase [Candidatus Marinimicrobia bacterium]|nr:2-hydroxy-3-oxopropionate reductase [Candidatus Neomarinimicrobiota bacterium]